MALIPRSLARLICHLTALSPVACSGGRSDAVPSSDSARTVPAAISTPAATAETPFAFTDADLDAYEKGMRKEIELVKAAKARGDSAENTGGACGRNPGRDSKRATAPAAAQAIGAPLDRYQATRRTVNRVFETLDFQGKIPGPMEIDTARASPDMKKRLAADPLQALPRPHRRRRSGRDSNALSRVWIEYMTLVAVNG